MQEESVMRPDLKTAASCNDKNCAYFQERLTYAEDIEQDMSSGHFQAVLVAKN